jgi:hypothetical protein
MAVFKVFAWMVLLAASPILGRLQQQISKQLECVTSDNFLIDEWSVRGGICVRHYGSRIYGAIHLFQNDQGIYSMLWNSSIAALYVPEGGRMTIDVHTSQLALRQQQLRSSQNRGTIIELVTGATVDATTVQSTTSDRSLELVATMDMAVRFLQVPATVDRRKLASSTLLRSVMFSILDQANTLLELFTIPVIDHVGIESLPIHQGTEDSVAFKEQLNLQSEQGDDTAIYDSFAQQSKEETKIKPTLVHQDEMESHYMFESHHTLIALDDRVAAIYTDWSEVAKIQVNEAGTLRLLDSHSIAVQPASQSIQVIMTGSSHRRHYDAPLNSSAIAPARIKERHLQTPTPWTGCPNAPSCGVGARLACWTTPTGQTSQICICPTCQYFPPNTTYTCGPCTTNKFFCSTDQFSGGTCASQPGTVQICHAGAQSGNSINFNTLCDAPSTNNNHFNHNWDYCGTW